MRLKLQLFYFSLFFGFGGFLPLLSVYLKEEVHLNGTQIGMMMSVIPIVTIFAQPLWGMLCDVTRKPKHVLTLTLIMTALASIPYLFIQQFSWLFLVTALLAIFQSAAIPVSDSITLSYVHRVKEEYGRYRMWGAIGFALAAYIMGELSEWTGPTAIFYGFIIMLAVSALFAIQMPNDRQSFEVNWGEGIKKLLHYPQFLLFMLATFSIFGPIHANNTYFGLFITELGGTIAGVGLAFLLAAGSEAPFMHVAGRWIHKHGLLPVIIFASVVSGLRWLFYYFDPSMWLVYSTTVVQGLSIGLFIPAALQYVRTIAPKDVQATAVALYAAVGTGVGNWFMTFFGGVLLDRLNIYMTYLFFSLMTFFGVLLLVLVARMERKRSIGPVREALKPLR